MPPVIFWGLAGVGAALMWLIDQKEAPKKPSQPVEPPPPAEKPVNREELRRVMSHLGKRSGKVRGGKL